MKPLIYMLSRPQAGFDKLKSELEDLSLKYTEKDVYYHIKES